MQRNSSKPSAPSKALSNGISGTEKTPMGQCPLCYTENPYTLSHCAECNLPLPWARAEMHEREPCGHCLKCESENPYTSLNCWSCGARLPWANAVSPLAQASASSSSLNGLALPAANGYSSNGYSSNGHHAPNGHAMPQAPMPITGPTTLRIASSSYVTDEPNQIIDAVSLVCPPLGFVAYVTLLGQLPRQAMNAARFAMYGLGVWIFLLGFFFVLPNVKLGKFGKKTVQAAVPTVAVDPNSEEASEIYQ